jgi:hypothetical protein
MAEIHQLITREGTEAARRQATSPTEVSLAEIASRILTEESRDLGMMYAGWALTGLPHKKLPDDAIWRRKGHYLTLVVDPGVRENGSRIGIPYGSRARLILLYLQTRAIQTNCAEIELGRSMREWLSRMGVGDSGKNYADFRAQAERISACNLTFFWEQAGGGHGFKKSSLVTEGLRLSFGDSRQGELWQDTVRLSDEYFRALRDHPVPVWEPAIREISDRSMAMDIYVWLSYRLHSLRRPTPIGKPALFDQFGGGFATTGSFWQAFKAALAFALAVYPEAKVEVVDGGLILHESAPPVERRVVAALSSR